MTLLTIPRATIPLLADDGVSISPEWYRCIRDLSERVGGVSGVGTDDLDRSAFEDAGIEEVKAWAYSAQDEQRQNASDAESIRAQLFTLQKSASDDQWPRPQLVEQEVVTQLVSDIASLQAQMFVLQKSIESLQQGTML